MIIAQITDTHIMPSGQHWLSEPMTQTSERLKRVIAYLAHLDPQPDFLMVTGDIVDGTELLPAYENFKEILRPLEIPYYVLPGNHDSREFLRTAFKDRLPLSGPLQYVVEHSACRAIALDSWLDGKDYGKLSAESLAWLKETLNRLSDRPALLFVHHFPVTVGGSTFDSIRLFDDGKFEELVRFFPNVLGVACGHFHNQFSTTFGGKPLFIAPSTAPNFYFENNRAMRPAGLELEDPALTLHFVEGQRWSSKSVRVVKPENRLNFLEVKGRQSSLLATGRQAPKHM